MKATLSFQKKTSRIAQISFLMAMLLCALLPYDLRAQQVVQIGSGTTNNQYLPSYSYYNYSLTEQIYTAAEIGMAGTITSIAFYNANTTKTRSYDMYLVHTNKSTFSSTTDWVAVTTANRVFSGSVTMTSGTWTTINLTTPFEYDGASNLLLVMDDNTGSYSSGMKCYVFSATNQTLRVYSDGTNYNPASPSSYSGTRMSVKNQIKLTITPQTGPVADCAWESAAGTSSSPYVISSASDLECLRDRVASGETYAGKYFRLSSNISVSSWSGIGNSSHPFSGHFNGNGKTITVSGSQGVFNYVEDAEIYDLTVAGSISGSATAIGGVVAHATNSSVNNCTNRASISTSSYCAGGIVGYAYITPITNCSNTGNITSTYTSNNSNGGLGGIVGYAYGDAPYTESVTSNSTFESSNDWTLVNGSQPNYWTRGTSAYQAGSYSMYITNGSGNSYTISSESNVWMYKDITIPEGALLTFNWKADAESCCDYINVYISNSSTLTVPEAGSTTVSNATQLGGSLNQQTTWQTAEFDLSAYAGSTHRIYFKWHNDGSVGTQPPAAIDNIKITARQYTGAAIVCSNCTNTGTVSAHTSYGYYTGGIAGQVANRGSIASCTNSGNVTGYYYTGGLVGYSHSTAANALTVTDGTNSGQVKGYYYIGGLLGTMVGTSVANSHNNGIVTRSTYSTSTYYMGGLAGATNYFGGSVQNYGSSITNCSNTAAVTGYYYTGGLVGRLTNGTVLTNCENTADVTATSSYVGGISGYAYGASGTEVTITATTNTGNVTTSGGYVGGISGYLYYATADQCVNVGKVSSTGSSSYAGGIVGYGSSYGYVQNCLNAGHVEGYATIGGLAGYGTYVYTSLNVGQVTMSESSANTSRAAIFGSGSTSTSYNDRQMCPTPYIYGTTSGESSTYNKMTQELTAGTSLPSGFSTSYWTHTDGTYPRPAAVANTNAALLAASPIFLQNGETTDGVGSCFTASTANSVSWEIGQGTPIELVSGRYNVIEPGSGQMIATRNGISKIVDVTTILAGVDIVASAPANCGGENITLTVAVPAGFTPSSIEWARDGVTLPNTATSIDITTPYNNVTYTVSLLGGECPLHGEYDFVYHGITGATLTAETVCHVTSQPQELTTSTNEQLLAQNAGDYTFSVSNRTFEPITSSNQSVSTGDDYYTVVNIGFPFQYCGEEYTQVNVSTNGYVRLGGITGGTLSNDLSSTSYNPVIAAYWDDIDGDVMYVQTLGTAPNRVFVFQTTGDRLANASFTYQIRLYETTNVIEIHYGSTFDMSSADASIGLNSKNNNTLSYLSVTPTGNGTATASNTSVNNSISTTQAAYLTAGTLYTFSPVAGNYTWYANGTPIAQGVLPTLTVDPAENTTYQFVISNDAGCSATSNEVSVNVVSAITPTASQTVVCPPETATISLPNASEFTSILWSTGETTPEITVAPGSNTTYTVTVTSANGCQGTDEITILADAPEAALTSSDNGECVEAGAEVTLSVGGGIEGTVTIGSATGTTYYFPIDNFFNYSCTEQIFLPSEIGGAGTIRSISMQYAYSDGFTASNVTMYMKNVSRSSFSSTTDYEPLSASDIVWNGTLSTTGTGWITITLDQPFSYDGTHNLLVAFYDPTNGYPGTSYVFNQTTSPNSANMASRYYSDSDIPNPYDLGSYSGSKVLYTYRMDTKFEIVSPMHYVWSDGSRTASITVSPTETTTYTVTVTDDAFSCPAILSHTVRMAPALTVSPENPMVCVGGTVTLTASGADSYQWSNGSTDASVIVSGGSYTVTGTKGNCTTTVNVTVNELATPSAGTIADVEVCASDIEITIPSITPATGGGNVEYQWTIGAVTTDWSENDISYTLTAADRATLGSDQFTATRTYRDDCGNTGSTTAQLNINPPMTQPSVAGLTTIFCGESTTLTASSHYTSATIKYRWFSDPEGRNLIYEGPSFTTPSLDANTTYYLQIVDELMGPGTPTDFSTSGAFEYTVPEGADSLVLEVWGAQGGYRSSTTYGGKGGYSVGTLTDYSNISTLYVTVGGSGNSGGTSGGYNGGGSRDTYAGGGGATHIATASGLLKNLSNNRDAVLIVAGGGGSDGASDKMGMYGGGLQGGTTTQSYGDGGGGGSQTAGGTGSSSTSNSGSFGQGGQGYYASSGYAGAGGGGWFGGGGSYPDSSGDDDRGGGGGSGYVSSLLADGRTVAGSETFPAPGGSTETGHSGNGYARITPYFHIQNGCPSELMAVTVNVTVAPAPTVDIRSACIDQPSELVIVNPIDGFQYQWSTTADFSVIEHTGTTFTPTVNTTTQYYVRSVVGNGTEVRDFDFSGSVQNFTVPAGTSRVLLEVWGAEGGQTTYGSYVWFGGRGGYASGTLQVSAGDVLSVYVGGKGGNGATGSVGTAAGGWNGGGASGTSSNSSYFYGGAGGGATDVRLNGTALTDRVIVAGAGGGAGYGESVTNTIGAGDGGGLNGLRASYSSSSYETRKGSGGTQTAGGAAGTYSSEAVAGSLGNGGAGGAGAASGGGGGGGYYGGGGGNYGSQMAGGGGGGSAYIGGVLDGTTLAGNESFTEPDGTVATGHTGNGFARITLLDMALDYCPSETTAFILDPTPAPDFTLTASSATYCHGEDAVVLTVTPASTSPAIVRYDWSDGVSMTENTREVTPGHTITYTVSATTGTCAVSQEVTIGVDAPEVTLVGSNNGECVDAGSVVTISSGLAGGECPSSLNMSSGTIILSSGCSFSYYDHNGPSSNYSDYEDFTQTFTSADGSPISIVFTSVGAESCCDYMYIYDGPNTSGTSLYSSHLYVLPTNTVYTANTGSLTIHFTSDVSNSGLGWVATITVEDRCTYAWSDGSNSSSISVSPTETATYTVTVSDNDHVCPAILDYTVRVKPVITLTSEPQSLCDPSDPAVLTVTGGDSYLWNDMVTTSDTYNANGPGTYMVTATSNNGCEVVASYNLVAPEFSAGSINSNSVVICQSETAPVIISSSDDGQSGGNIHYRWYRGTDLLPNSDSPTYQISTDELSSLAPANYQYTREVQNGCLGDWHASTGTYNLSVTAAFEEPTVYGTENYVICGTDGKMYVSHDDEIIHYWYEDAACTQLYAVGDTVIIPNMTENKTLWHVAQRGIVSQVEGFLRDGFESGSFNGWTSSASSGSNSWSVGSGDYSISDAHTGSYNAVITHNESGEETYLISPMINMEGATEATLSFWYINESWAGDIDYLTVYYRVNNGTWQALFNTTVAHATWTQQILTLPNLASNYQIGFKMTDNYGYGIGIDDFDVTYSGTQQSFIGCPSIPAPYTLQVADPSAPVVENVTTYCGLPATLAVTDAHEQLTYHWSTQSDFSDTVSFGTSLEITEEAGVYTYYVRSYYGNNYCESAPTMATVTVQDVPAIEFTDAHPQIDCGLGTTLTVSNPIDGYIYEWFADAACTESLGQGTSLDVSNITGDSTFYVKSYLVLGGSDTIDFEYTGAEQTYTVPEGINQLTLEVWGAEGGINSGNTGGVAGKGGYSIGRINVSPEDVLHIYVGGQGGAATATCGGWNGGGISQGIKTNLTNASGGGGGTDIRVNSESLYARVIVAGGGGGNGYGSSGTDANGGYGGGIEGGIGTGSADNHGMPGTQTSAGVYPGGSDSEPASFGVGGGGPTGTVGAGGGGGWYGGSFGTRTNGAGGGGSGYVYTSATASNYPTGCLLNSSYYLTDAQTIAGNVTFLAPDGTAETGHSGNGFARISYNIPIGRFCESTVASVTVSLNEIEAPVVNLPATVVCGTTLTLAVSNPMPGFKYVWFSDQECHHMVHEGISWELAGLNNTADTVYYVKACKEAIGSSHEDTTNFEYTGSEQTYTIPEGIASVTLQVWGAQGGSHNSSVNEGGRGGYTEGTLTNLAGLSTLYVNVGGQGGTTTGGYNGGGNSNYGAGGGATHIATTSGVLRDLYNDRESVLVVAGGGGGRGNASNGFGGYGGGLQAGRGSNGTDGGGDVVLGGMGASTVTDQGLGFGGRDVWAEYGGGGGGGWYAGENGYSPSGTKPGGGGGSGNFSPILTNARTLAGYLDILAPDGNTETGHMGNGAARIIATYPTVYTCESEVVEVRIEHSSVPSLYDVYLVTPANDDMWEMCAGETVALSAHTEYVSDYDDERPSVIWYRGTGNGDSVYIGFTASDESLFITEPNPGEWTYYAYAATDIISAAGEYSLNTLENYSLDRTSSGSFYFDVTTPLTMRLHGIEVYTANQRGDDVTVYYATQSGNGLLVNPTAWNNLGTYHLEYNATDPVRIELNDTITIPAGQTYSFYLMAQNGLYYSNISGLSRIGYDAITGVEIYAGEATSETNAFPPATHNPRQFKGGIHYMLTGETRFGCVAEQAAEGYITVDEPSGAADTITIVDDRTIVCVGQDDITLHAMGAYLGSNVEHVWIKEVAGGYEELGTGESITVPVPDATTNYGVYLRSTYCGNTDTIFTTITVAINPDIADIMPDTICAYGSLNLTAPSLNVDGPLSIDGYGWEVSQDGTNFERFTAAYDTVIGTSYNGWYIRYMATSQCATGYSNSVQIVVDTAAYFDELTAPDAICAGNTFNWANNTAEAHYINNSGREIRTGWNLFAGGELVEPFDAAYTFSYNSDPNYYQYNCYIVTACDSIVSNLATITVWDIPGVGAIEGIGATCAGLPVTIDVPEVTPYGPVDTVGWEYADAIGSNYFDRLPADFIIDYTMNNKVIRYFAENACGSHESNPVQITIIDRPYVADIEAIDTVCSGTTFEMTAPAVTDNGGVDDYTTGWYLSENEVVAENENVVEVHIGDPMLQDIWDGKYLHFGVTNDCGTRYSNGVKVTTRPDHHLAVTIERQPYGTSTETAIVTDEGCFGPDYLLTAVSDLRDQAVCTYAWTATTGANLATTNTESVMSQRPEAGLQRYIVTVTEHTFGCSATDTVLFNVNLIHTDTSVTVCQSDLPYVFDPVDNASYSFDQSGDYQVVYQTESGCDSVINLHLNVHYPLVRRATLHFCNNESFTWRGETYGGMGIEDTVITDGDTIISYTWMSDLHWDSEAQSWVSGSLCDSIIYLLELNISNEPYMDIPQDEFTLPVGETVTLEANVRKDCEVCTAKSAIIYQLYKDGVPVDNVLDYGEISVDTYLPDVNHTFGNALSSGRGEIPGNTFAINSYNYNYFYAQFFGEIDNHITATWRQPGEYKLQLVIIRKSTATGQDFPMTYRYVENNPALSETGYANTVMGGANALNTDSVFTDTAYIYFHVGTVTDVVIDTVVCANAFPFEYHATNIEGEGRYEISTGSEGEFTRYFLNVTTNPVDTTVLTVNTTNDYYEVNNQTYSDGTYTVVLAASTGCDSILVLTVNTGAAANSDTVYVTACHDYTWDVTGTTYDVDGVYTEGEHNLSLTVLDAPYGEATLYVTAMQFPYTYEGMEYTDFGTYRITYPADGDCDSIVDLHIVEATTGIDIDTVSFAAEVGEENNFNITILGGELSDLKVSLDYEITRNGVLVDQISDYGSIYFTTEYPDIHRTFGNSITTGTGSVPANTFAVLYYQFDYFYMRFFSGIYNNMTATWTVPGEYKIKFFLREREGGHDIPLTSNNLSIGGHGATAGSIIAIDSVIMHYVGDTIYTDASEQICDSQIGTDVVYNYHGFQFTETATGLSIYSPYSEETEEVAYTTTTDNMRQLANYELFVYDPYRIHDTVVDFTLTINKEYRIDYSANICAGTDYQDINFTLTANQITRRNENGVATFVLNGRTEAGCDSVVTLTLNVIPNPSLRITANTLICEGMDVPVMVTVTSPINYNNVIETNLSTNYIVRDTSSTNVETIQVMDTIFDISESTVIYATTTNSLGSEATQDLVTCMTTDTVHITVYPIDTIAAPITAEVCQGEPFELINTAWVQRFNISSQRTWNAIDPNNRVPVVIYDTIITGFNSCGRYYAVLELTVNPIFGGRAAPLYIYDEVCEGYDYDGGANGYFLTADSIAATISPNATYAEFAHYDIASTGCDSMTVLRLTVLPTVYGQDEFHICTTNLPYEYSFDANQVVTITTDTVVNFLMAGAAANTCDSIVAMSFIIDPLPEFTVEGMTEICENAELSLSVSAALYDSIKWYVAGAVYAEGPDMSIVPGGNIDMPDDVEVSIYGGICVATETVSITYLPTYHVYDTMYVCDNEFPYEWNGVTFTGAGDQTTTLQTVNGCDSVVEMTVIANPTYHETVDITITSAELPYTYNNVTFEMGTPAHSSTDFALVSATQCDSIVTLNLTVTYDDGTQPFMLVDSVDATTKTLTVFANEMPLDSKVSVNYHLYKNNVLVENVMVECGGNFHISTEFQGDEYGMDLTAAEGNIPENTFHIGNNYYDYFYFAFFNGRTNTITHNFTEDGEYDIVFELVSETGGTDFAMPYDNNYLHRIGGKNSTEGTEVLASATVHFGMPISGSQDPHISGAPNIYFTPSIITDATSTAYFISSTNNFGASQVAINYEVYRDNETEPLSMLTNVGTLRFSTEYNGTMYGDVLTSGTGTIPTATFHLTSTCNYEYFYLNFLAYTRNVLAATWNVPGTYKVVFNLMEVQNGQDFPFMFNGQRFGGKNATEVRQLSTATVTYNITTVQNPVIAGIDDNVEVDGFGLYPNPANDRTVMTLGNVSDNASIVVTDVNGKEVYRAAVTDTRVEFNVATWSEGVYFVTLRDNDQIVTKKLVVTK